MRLKMIQKKRMGAGIQLVKKNSIRNKLEVKIFFLKALIFLSIFFFSLLSLNIFTKILFSANSSFLLMQLFLRKLKE